jgi:hypothetical protein
MWRCHSWLVRLDATGRPTIHETTDSRIAYFGFLRTEDEALDLLDGPVRTTAAEDVARIRRELVQGLELRIPAACSHHGLGC